MFRPCKGRTVLRGATLAGSKIFTRGSGGCASPLRLRLAAPAYPRLLSASPSGMFKLPAAICLLRIRIHRLQVAALAERHLVADALNHLQMLAQRGQGVGGERLDVGVHAAARLLRSEEQPSELQSHRY